MKGYFPRNTLIATGLTVAWSLVSHPVLAQGGLEIAYQQGYDEGLRACQNQCNDEKSGLLSPEQCNSQYNGYITQGACDSQKSGLITQGDCNSQYNGYITQDACNSKYNGYILQSSCPVSDEATCKSTYRLLTQGECNSNYSGYILQSNCPVSDEATCKSKHTLIAKSDCAVSDAAICKSTHNLITQAECSDWDVNRCKSTYTTTLFTLTELNKKETDAIAKYTGYVDTTTDPATPTPTSCQETPKPAECIGTTLKGFKEGYAEGKTAGTTATAIEVAKYTGYVDTTNPATPIAMSCTATPENTECTGTSKKKGFKDGYNEGQLSLAGYAFTEENGKTVPKPCVKGSSETLHTECQSSLKGFQDGYTLGQNNPDAAELAKCKTAPESPTCTNQAFKDGYTAGKNSALTSTQCDPTTDISKCQNYDTIKTYCQTHLAECGINVVEHLQAFYDYFVKQRLQNVTDKEKSFPTTLTVKQLGGINDNIPADQWRYTWVSKQKGCNGVNSGERFKPSDTTTTDISICLGQTDDAKVKDLNNSEFGNSKDTTALGPNQSLGYTVYLMDETTVKATMEIIFSPTAAATTPVTEGGTTSDTTGGTADTAAAGVGTDATETGSTTSDTGETNP